MKNKQNIKQRIIIPNDIHKLGNILALPCVRSVEKDALAGPYPFAVQVHICNSFYPWRFAIPGDALVETDEGWMVEDGPIDVTKNQ